MGFAADYAHRWVRAAAAVDVAAVERATQILGEARARDSTVWTLGNGGSGTLAAHLAIGLTLNVRRMGGRPFRASCLGADAAAMSAAVNDFGADHAFEALLECNARRGDVLCVFSASGESRNVNTAILAAKRLGLEVIALVGSAASTAARLADHGIDLGTVEPAIAEDVASAIMHALYCAFMYEKHEVPSDGSVDGA